MALMHKFMEDHMLKGNIFKTCIGKSKKNIYLL